MLSSDSHEFRAAFWRVKCAWRHSFFQRTAVFLRRVAAGLFSNADEMKLPLVAFGRNFFLGCDVIMAVFFRRFPSADRLYDVTSGFVYVISASNGLPAYTIAV